LLRASVRQLGKKHSQNDQFSMPIHPCIIER